MGDCATTGCDDPNCGPCTVSTRFAHVPTYQRASELKATAPALNGVKPRASRDPRFIPRKRKALER